MIIYHILNIYLHHSEALCYKPEGRGFNSQSSLVVSRQRIYNNLTVASNYILSLLRTA
jgi:hypothetical protein